MKSEEEQWSAVKQRLKIGDEVEGIVVHKAPFGDFLEIGAGFPALLEVIVMKDLTPEKYRDGNYNPVGSKISATIVSFEETPNKLIRLAQKQIGY